MVTSDTTSDEANPTNRASTPKSSADVKTVHPSQAPQEPTVIGPSATSSTRQLMPLVPAEGDQLGGYKLEQKIGEGGMGTVWKAFHTRLKKHVAVKLLPPHLLSDPSRIARFEREMEAVGRLDHPAIVRALDAGEIQGTHYLVMEFVEGVDLNDDVRTRGVRSVKDACELVRQAAVGLAYAHQHGLIHRDIKPSNLFLTKEGKVKILDLGLARLQGDDRPAEANFELTGSGQILGTPDYMAPEQWENTHTVGPACDLYALGCTLHFLMTGRPPFADEKHASMPSKMMGHVHEDIPDVQAARRTRFAASTQLNAKGATPPPKGDAAVPAEVAAIYRRLMAKKPADRFASAEELAKALRDFLKPQAPPSVIAAPPPPPAPEPLPFIELPPAPNAATRISSMRRGNARKKKPPGGLPPLVKWLAAGGLGAVALVLLAVIVIKITNKDGSTTTIVLPDAKKVEVSETKAPDPTPKPVTPTPARPMPPASTEFPPPLGKFGKVEETLGGILPLPAELPGFGRWQLEWRRRFDALDLAISPNGKHLAIVSYGSGAVRIFEMEPWKQVAILPGPPANISDASVKWSPDGKWLAVGGCSRELKGWLGFWKSGDPTVVRHEIPGGIYEVAWHPTEPLVVAGGNSQIVFCRPDEKPSVFKEASTNAVDWCPDGVHFIASDGVAPQIWHRDGTKGPLLAGHTANVHRVACSSKGVIATAVEREAQPAIRLWSIDGKLLHTIPVEIYPWEIAWNADGTLLAATPHLRDQLLVFDAEGKLRHDVPMSLGVNPKLLSWRGDDIIVGVYQSSGLRRVGFPAAPDQKPVVQNLSDDKWQVSGIGQSRWSPDGEWLTAVSNEVWSFRRDGSSKQIIQRYGGGSYCVESWWSPDGRFLAVLYSNRMDIVLFTPEGKVHGEVLGFPARIDGHSSTAWSPDSQFLAVSTVGETVLRRSDGAHAPTLEGQDQSDRLRPVVWNSQGEIIGTGKNPDRLQCWNAQGKAVRSAPLDSDCVALSCSPDGQWLAVSRQGMLELRSPQTLEVVARREQQNVAHPFNTLCWSPDSRQFAATVLQYSFDVQVFDTQARPVATLANYPAFCESLDWSAQNQIVASRYSALTVWDGSTYEPQWTATIFCPDPARYEWGHLIVSSSGERLSSEFEIDEAYMWLHEQPDGRIDMLTAAEFEQRRQAWLKSR